MLPDRSKRYAGIDGEIPRLRLAAVWQLVVIAIIMVGLLVVIFPRKTLIEKLVTQERLDPLTLSYVDNLRRTDPGNVELSLLLARVQRQSLDTREMEDLTLPVIARGNADQKAEARILLIEAYLHALERNPSPVMTARLGGALEAQLNNMRPEEVSPRVANMLSDASFRIGKPQLALSFLNRANAAHSGEVLVQQARIALGQGRYALSSEYYFMALRQSTDLSESRKLFRDGVGVLMQASLFEQAMQASDREAGKLAEDPDTIRYLARTSLAAGDPGRAVRYARKLVFADFGTIGSGVLKGSR